MSMQEDLSGKFVEILKEWISKNESSMKRYPSSYFRELEQLVSAQYLLIQKTN